MSDANEPQPNTPVYRPVVDRWSIYDNSKHPPLLLAYGDAAAITVTAKDAFENLVREFNLSL